MSRLLFLRTEVNYPSMVFYLRANLPPLRDPRVSNRSERYPEKRNLRLAPITLFVFALLLLGCKVHDPFYRPGSSNELLPEKGFAQNLNLPSRQVALLPRPKLEVNEAVRAQIARFSRTDHSFLIRSLERKSAWGPVMENIFLDEGIPLELINLAMIESGFRADAKSPAGAVGMWQFMKTTARAYGLKVSLFEDDRKDPILATIAAARHLRDLYGEFGSWWLVLAAYNAGSGKVRRCIQAAGTNDFWELSRRGFFRKETRDYIPRFIAVTLIQRDPDQYAFEMPPLESELGLGPVLPELVLARKNREQVWNDNLQARTKSIHHLRQIFATNSSTPLEKNSLKEAS